MENNQCIRIFEEAPILLYVYLWYPHMSFRHLKVSPKNDGLVVELEDTDETCRRRKKRVSQFLNLVNLTMISHFGVKNTMDGDESPLNGRCHHIFVVGNA